MGEFMVRWMALVELTGMYSGGDDPSTRPSSLVSAVEDILIPRRLGRVLISFLFDRVLMFFVF